MSRYSFLLRNFIFRSIGRVLAHQNSFWLDNSTWFFVWYVTELSASLLEHTARNRKFLENWCQDVPYCYKISFLGRLEQFWYRKSKITELAFPLWSATCGVCLSHLTRYCDEFVIYMRSDILFSTLSYWMVNEDVMQRASAVRTRNSDRCTVTLSDRFWCKLRLACFRSFLLVYQCRRGLEMIPFGPKQP